MYVGPVDDPFFFDLGVIFDAINIDKPGRPNIGLGNQGGGKDDVSGYNTHAFVLQVPESEVTRNGRSVSGARSSNAAVGVWASTERRRVTVLGSQRSRSTTNNGGGYVQVSRLGNPLINEVIIPIGQKDKFNRTDPADDARNFGRFALNPEPARLMNALFGLGVKETNRTDIVQALLTGIPGLTQIGRNRPRPTRSRSTSAWRRARRRTASASWPAMSPGSPTAAVWPMTSWTSSCASSPVRC